MIDFDNLYLEVEAVADKVKELIDGHDIFKNDNDEEIIFEKFE